jgi:site-specific DNA-methyltransferase (adenine-specific)
MRPYYEHAGITIYHGDCREVLPGLVSDVVITDPPYGSVTHAGARSAKSLDSTIISFSSITGLELVDIAKRCLDSARRWVVMTCDWRHAVELEDLLGLVRLGVWIKPNGAPQFTGDRPGTGWEAIAILHKPGIKRWNGGGHHAVWHHGIEQGSHPAQKPLGLIKQWVLAFSDKDETVLDPYMGSGTTLVAAKQLSRKAIGIELEEKYCEVAAKRLEQEVFEFAPQSTQPEQLALA